MVLGKDLNKKFIYIFINLILIFSLFSGCLNKTEYVKESDLLDNIPPIAKIFAPYEAYFGDNVEFDASNSYDLDGKITSYSWNFGDEENIEGIKINHSFKFENNFFIKYPLIYPVTLFIKDNKGSLSATTYLIKIYPKEYKFYLCSNGLSAEKPLSSMEKIKSFVYRLENPIIIKKCSWYVTLYLEKPLLLSIKKLTLTLYDSKEEVICSNKVKFGISIFWKEKTVMIGGEIKDEVEFKSLKIEINSYSFLSKTKIIYGGEKSSFINFDFSNY